MAKWEYLIEKFESLSNKQENESDFNDLGKSEWELVTICMTTEKEGSPFYAIFKRATE